MKLITDEETKTHRGSKKLDTRGHLDYKVNQLKRVWYAN